MVFNYFFGAKIERSGDFQLHLDESPERASNYPTKLGL
jgi:hypothetical protein